MTDKPWLPQHPVDAELARTLVHAACPDLVTQAPERVGEGWDCDVWRFGDLAFRFPRRPQAVPLVATEIRALAWLGPRLPVAIPAPARVGTPGDAFPHPWYGHPFVAGTTADRVAPDGTARAALAPQLGAFLKALHALDPAEAAAHGVPADAFRGAIARMMGLGLQRLALLEGSPWADRIPAARALMEAAPPSAEGVEPVVLHGDLYARHLLLGDGGLVGVIDWGDVNVGDRAVDLALAESFLPVAARPAFYAAYGAVDAATRARARALGLARYGVSLLAYALDVGDGVLAAEAGRALDQALA